MDRVEDRARAGRHVVSGAVRDVYRRAELAQPVGGIGAPVRRERIVVRQMHIDRSGRRGDRREIEVHVHPRREGGVGDQLVHREPAGH